MLYFLVRRDIRVRYTQSVFGVGWAVIQPVFFMIVFSVVFGRLAGVKSDGVPYPIFSFAALVPWTYFSTAFTESTNSLVLNQPMVQKVYFPRLALPLAPVIARLVDFVVAFVVLVVLMAWYRSAPTVWVLVLPFLLLLASTLAWGIGTWLTSMAVQYRDVKYGLAFAAQLMMYCSPSRLPGDVDPGPVQAHIRPEPDGRRRRGLPVRPARHDADALGPAGRGRRNHRAGNAQRDSVLQADGARVRRCRVKAQ